MGSDCWTVRQVRLWVSAALPAIIASGGPGAAVLDAGCGAQPFRSLVERAGGRYVGMDATQNAAGSVEILSTLEATPRFDAAFPIVLCTEVMEHVADVDAAFAGLRRACTAGGVVVMTVPFLFPLHMEPYDFRRLTLHGVRQLATRHGFHVESSERLGSATDVLSTMLADVSILPTTRSVYARIKVRAARALKAAAIRAIQSPFARSNVAMHSNLYLTNGVILRAV